MTDDGPEGGGVDRPGVADLGAAGAEPVDPAPVARLGAAPDPDGGPRVADLAGVGDLAGRGRRERTRAATHRDTAPPRLRLVRGSADPGRGVGAGVGADAVPDAEAAAELIVQRDTGPAGGGTAPDDRRQRPGRHRRGSDEPAPRPERRRGGPPQIDPDGDPIAAAREICLRLLTDRSRTRQELAQALRRRGVPDEAAETVLGRFDEVGLIDDAAFAGQWVRSRHRSRGLARRAIAMELRRKGVDEQVAADALAEVDGDAEERRARELVDRKLRTVPADTPEQRAVAARRLVGMLGRKGYPGGIAYRVVREALAAHGADDDELGTDPVDG